MGKILPVAHNGIAHGWIRTNKPINARVDEEKDGPKLLVDSRFPPEFPTPDTQFYAGR